MSSQPVYAFKRPATAHYGAQVGLEVTVSALTMPLQLVVTLERDTTIRAHVLAGSVYILHVLTEAVLQRKSAVTLLTPVGLTGCHGVVQQVLVECLPLYLQTKITQMRCYHNQ